MVAIRISCCLLIFTIVLIGFSAAAQERGKPEKIRVGIPSWSSTYFSLIAAKKHGYYARHGLDVEVIVVHSAISPQALASGELDFDTSTTRDMSLALKGVPVRLVMALTKAPVHALIVKPDIRTAKDLKGRILGIDTPKTLNERLIILGLKKYGLVPGVDVSLLPLGGGGSDVRLTALLTGRVDGTLLAAPFSTLATLKHGFRTLFVARDFSNVYSASLAATTDKMRRHPDAIVRAIKGTIEGIGLLRNKKGEFLKLLAQEARVTDSQLAEEIYKEFLETVAENGIPPDSATIETIAFVKDLLGMTREVPISEIADWSFAQRAIKELKEGR
jgi:ABC-type nitrate/sulfonate/bicarbonate transport system substrate-binding protein